MSEQLDPLNTPNSPQAQLREARSDGSTGRSSSDRRRQTYTFSIVPNKLLYVGDYKFEPSTPFGDHDLDEAGYKFKTHNAARVTFVNNTGDTRYIAVKINDAAAPTTVTILPSESHNVILSVGATFLAWPNPPKEPPGIAAEVTDVM